MPYFEPHQLRQQLTARDYRDLVAAGFLDFRVRGIDRRAHHNRLRSCYVGRGVTLVNPGAERRQSIGGRAQLQVRAGDFISQVQQHFGDAAHANAADSDEVEVLRLKKHFNLVLFRLSR